MMEQVKTGKINCIIVKDLSRFGRDYIDSGRYIEKIFPSLGIRFIAINDNYDSAQSQQVGNEIILPFKNLINDSYSRDISIKIRSNLETKRRNGEFVGSHVVYGYRRSDDDKNKLVIDQTVAPVIQSIFSMKMDGFSPAQIADKLNKDGVPSPYEYKRQSGSKYQSGFKKQIQTDWGAKAIYRILKNEMYTGTLVQGKTTTPNHKIKSRTTKDEADWMRTENAHDAIISPSIFDMVQKLMLEDTRSPSGDNSVHLFSGKVFCADCQSTMTRKKTKSAGKEYVYFVCNANKVDRKVCNAHTVKEQVVYDAALAVVQAQVSLALNLEIALGKLNGISWERREMERIASKIARQEEVIEHNKQMKAHVYEDFKTEMITREEYFTFKCPTYAEHGARACNAKKMRKADLDEAVLSTIQAQLDLFVDMQDSLHQLLVMKKAMAKQNGQKNEIKSLQKKLDHKKGLFGGLYRDLREGLISDEDYAQTREVILGEIKRLEKQLAELEGTTNRFEEQLRGEKKWAELVKKYHHATEVTAEMVDAMIVSMKMNKDSSLSIEFNHMDEFKAIYDTIDILRKEVA